MNIYELDTRKGLVKIINDESDRLDINADIISILHGNLYDPLVKKLRKDMPETWKDCVDRLMPINVYRRIMDKITHIYQTGVERNVDPENQADQDIMERYVKQVDLNDELNYNNMLYNSFGYSLQSIAIDEDFVPYTVAVDNDKFIPVNLSKSRKNNMDLLILAMGKDGSESIYWIWTDDQFMIMNQDGEVKWEHLSQAFGEDFDGDVTLNPYDIIPYTYLTSSKTKIMPEIAKDDLQIALTLAIIMSDMNYISKFTAFAIVWTIDIDSDQLPQAPNATWALKSGAGKSLSDEKNPQIGTIKPESDIQQLIDMVMFQLSTYLDTKGVPAGAIGKVDGANFQSGISKIIDHLDVSDLRQKQTKAYTKMEHDYFNRLFHFMNPLWIKEPDYQGDKHQYMGESQVMTSFPIQKPLVNRKETLEEIKMERDLGLSTKKRELKKLYPEMTEEEIDELLADIAKNPIVEPQQLRPIFEDTPDE